MNSPDAVTNPQLHYSRKRSSVQRLLIPLLTPPNHATPLASESADRALKKYAELTQHVEVGREGKGPSRHMSDYVESFVGFGGIFRIEIVEGEGGLETLFQGRESQRFQLRHHHDDAFTWLTSRDEQISRAMFIVFDPVYYMIRFEAGEGGEVVALNWVHDPGMSEGEDFLRE